MGALFGVVHDTIMDAKCSSDKHKEAFDKSWGISDVAHQANAPRIKNFERVRTNAIALLKTHANEILDARRRFLFAPTVPIKPSPQAPSVTHDEMEVDDKSGPTNPADSESLGGKMKMEKPSDLEGPPGELKLMYSRVAVFNESFRDCQMDIKTVPDPRHRIRKGSGPRPAPTTVVVLHVHI